MKNLPNEDKELIKIEIPLNGVVPIMVKSYYNDGSVEELEASSYIISVVGKEKSSADPTIMFGKPLDLIGASAALVAELSDSIEDPAKTAFIKLFEQLISAMKKGGSTHANFKADLESRIDPDEMQRFKKMLDKYREGGDVGFSV